MLVSLAINNYALISTLEIDFSSGLSVMTGETGAGKSIILGALSLILGQRADTKSIKQGENKCTIEGVFDVSSYDLQNFFVEKELEYDANHCILRRELWDSGKSRAFINDSPVGLNDLKELGSFLIDIHSQHQNLMLGEHHYQLQVLDVLAGNKPLKKEYTSAYQEYILLQKKWKMMKEEASLSISEEEYLKFQFKQLNEACLQLGEQEELEAEAQTLSHIEEIKGNLYRIEQCLSHDETGATIALKESVNTAQSLCKIFTSAAEFSERLQAVFLEVKDLAMEIAIKQEKLEFDPQRLQWINERLDALYSLQQKHKTDSIESLIAIREGIEEKLQTRGDLDEQLSILQVQMSTSSAKMNTLAAQLSETRVQAARNLEKQLVAKVCVLGMPNMQFFCELKTQSQADSSGMDEVAFLFSANKNVSLKPVSAIASGGEISRLILGIKALIAGATALPTIVFDEIDTGVSGEVADKMGIIMQEMGAVMQVLAITHLPQIASKGVHHYYVYKNENIEITETHIRKLSPEERIREVAQLLSGSSLTDAALENAQILISEGQKSPAI